MKTKKLILSALLIAISIILTRFLSFYVPIGGSTTVRAGIGHIPILLAGMFLGPLAGAFVGGISDVLGVVMFAPYAPFPGFTLSAVCLGFLAGLCMKFFKNKTLSFKHIVLLVFVAEIPASMFINTLSASILYAIPFSFLFPIRAVSTTVFSILYSILVYGIYKKLIRLDYIKSILE
ncbi:MAG: folate family ECF transporter S component [Peptostreptococcales bacterium]